MPLDKEGAHERKSERGAPPPLKGVILPLLARLTWKWLQIGTEMLLSIRKTGNKPFRNVNIDDLEWPLTPENRGYSAFFAISGCDTHFESELHRNAWR